MRWFLIAASLLLAGLLLGPTAERARAAKDAEKKAAKGDEGAEKPKVYLAEGGREFDLSKEQDQRDLIKTLQSEEVDHLTLKKERTFIEDMADLAIWTVVIFIVILLILGRYAWKPILEGLHKREENIRHSVEEAQRARDEAQQLRTQLQQDMAQSQAKVQELLEEGRRAAQRSADELIARAKGDVQAERDRLRREIESAKDQALQDIWTQAANVASAIASKALRRQLTADDQRRLVDEALHELPRAGTGRRA
jgi:F-type H+-transporting ATPase subunit b